MGKDGGLCVTIHLTGGLHLRHHRTRNLKQVQQLLIPLQRIDVKQHRTGSITYIRHVNFAAGQTPNQPGIDGTEQQFPFCSTFTSSGNMIQDPFDLRRTEIGIDNQTCFLTNHIGQSATL